MNKGSTWLTIALGLVLIAIITPLSQFLAIRTLNLHIETATPVGWAVGVVFALVLCLAAVRGLAATRLISRQNLVVLYCMLTIAVPVMNLGLVRHVVLSMLVAPMEYMVNATSTYRTFNASKHSAWTPVVPSLEAGAWFKAHRLLVQLDDGGAASRRTRAAEYVENAVRFRVSALQHAAEAKVTIDPVDDALKRNIADRIAQFGADEAARLQAMHGSSADHARAFEELGISLESLAQRREASLSASLAAAERLKALLVHTDELYASQTSARVRHMRQRDVPGLNRINRDMARRSLEDRSQVASRAELLQTPVGLLAEGRVNDPPLLEPPHEGIEVAPFALPEFEAVVGLVREFYGSDPALASRSFVEVLQADIGKLTRSDVQAVRQHLWDRYRELFAQVGDQAARDIVNSMVYRASTPERQMMVGPVDLQEHDRPNEDIRSISSTPWADAQAAQARDGMRVRDQFARVWETLPWSLWIVPLLSWWVLSVVMFLGMMLLAEWLRRKWIERENLAFPLVEVADHLIRHDQMLEHAQDIQRPDPRPWAFNPLLLIGMLVGATVIGLEALGHYEIFDPAPPPIAYNISEHVLSGGDFKEMDKVFLVLSPIVLGLAFLVSLEITFSVWVIFALYSIVTFVIASATRANPITDDAYTGWGGGRTFPFPMEQLLGACLCMTAILLYKSFRSRGGPGESSSLGQYIPNNLFRIGCIVVPLAVIALFYHMGITNILFLIFVAIILLAQTIAMARARAETGLHTHHVSYEFTKLPMIFGLTGWTGAKVYSVFVSVAFLPLTLLFRLLPQQLENLELARRHQVRYSVLAVSGLLAFTTAVAVGMFFFVLLGYYWGDPFIGRMPVWPNPGNSTQPYGIAAYPAWVSHFLGEPGLDKFNTPHTVRFWFMGAGIAIFGLLTYLRGKFLGFPLHPLGYFLILATIHFEWVSPYHQNDPAVGKEGTYIWFSVFVAWLCKFLIIKYGGMNSYKTAKPLFIGMILGSIVCVFGFNMVDLLCSLYAEFITETPGWFVSLFLEKSPYSPRLY